MHSKNKNKKRCVPIGLPRAQPSPCNTVQAFPCTSEACARLLRLFSCVWCPALFITLDRHFEPSQACQRAERAAMPSCAEQVGTLLIARYGQAPVVSTQAATGTNAARVAVRWASGAAHEPGFGLRAGRKCGLLPDALWEALIPSYPRDDPRHRRRRGRHQGRKQGVHGRR